MESNTHIFLPLSSMEYYIYFLKSSKNYAVHLQITFFFIHSLLLSALDTIGPIFSTGYSLHEIWLSFSYAYSWKSGEAHEVSFLVVSQELPKIHFVSKTNFPILVIPWIGSLIFT